MVNKKPLIGTDVQSIEKEFFGSKEDRPEDRSVSSRRRVSDQLEQEIKDFIARGGRINEVDPHVTADPPRKPSSSYGSRPI